MMSRKELLRSTYRWEVETWTGVIFDENSLKSPDLVDACRISLIPQRKGYERVDIRVPRGNVAVFYFTCIETIGGEFLKMIFRVGYGNFIRSIEVKQ